LERELTMVMSRRLVNLMTSLMPTMEGLFLASVLNGRDGIILFRFHESVAEEMEAMSRWLCDFYGDECRILS